MINQCKQHGMKPVCGRGSDTTGALGGTSRRRLNELECIRDPYGIDLNEGDGTHALYKSSDRTNTNFWPGGYLAIYGDYFVGLNFYAGRIYESGTDAFADENGGGQVYVVTGRRRATSTDFACGTYINIPKNLAQDTICGTTYETFFFANRYSLEGCWSKIQRFPTICNQKHFTYNADESTCACIGFQGDCTSSTNYQTASGSFAGCDIYQAPDPAPPIYATAAEARWDGTGSLIKNYVTTSTTSHYIEVHSAGTSLRLNQKDTVTFSNYSTDASCWLASMNNEISPHNSTSLGPDDSYTANMATVKFSFKESGSRYLCYKGATERYSIPPYSAGMLDVLEPIPVLGAVPTYYTHDGVVASVSTSAGNVNVMEAQVQVTFTFYGIHGLGLSAGADAVAVFELKTSTHRRRMYQQTLSMMEAPRSCGAVCDTNDGCVEPYATSQTFLNGHTAPVAQFTLPLTGSFQVCYKPAGVSNYMSVPGGTRRRSTGLYAITVYPNTQSVSQPPSAFTVSGTAEIYSIISIVMTGGSGWNTAPGYDSIKVIDDSDSCTEGTALQTVTDLGPDDSVSATEATAELAAFTVAGNYKICYKVAGGTWSHVKRYPGNNDFLSVSSVAPRLQSSTPASGSVDIDNTATTVQLHYRQEITIGSGTLTLAASGATTKNIVMNTGNVALSTDNKDATLTLSSDWKSLGFEGKFVYVTVGTGIFRTLVGSLSSVSDVFNLTIIDTTPPELSSISPASGATGVSVSSDLVLEFNEFIGGLHTSGGVITGTYTCCSGDTSTSHRRRSTYSGSFSFDTANGGAYSISSGVVTFVNPGLSEYWATYSVDIASGFILDKSNLPFAGLSSHTFTMAPSTDVLLGGLSVSGIPYTLCANEEGVCKCYGTLIYGRGADASEIMSYTHKSIVNQNDKDLTCSSVFMGGDPAPSHSKSCWCQSTLLSPSWSSTRKSYELWVTSSTSSILLNPIQGFKESAVAIGPATEGYTGTPDWNAATNFTLKGAGSITTVGLTVIAQDGLTSAVHSVAVTRARAGCNSDGIGAWTAWSACTGDCDVGVRTTRRTVVPQFCTFSVNSTQCYTGKTCNAEVQADASLSGMSKDKFEEPAILDAFKESVASTTGVTTADVSILSVQEMSTRRELKIVVEFKIKVKDQAKSTSAASSLQNAMDGSGSGSGTSAGSFADLFTNEAAARGAIVDVVVALASAPVLTQLRPDAVEPPENLHAATQTIFWLTTILVGALIMMMWSDVVWKTKYLVRGREEYLRTDVVSDKAELQQENQDLQLGGNHGITAAKAMYNQVWVLMNAFEEMPKGKVQSILLSLISNDNTLKKAIELKFRMADELEEEKHELMASPMSQHDSSNVSGDHMRQSLDNLDSDDPLKIRFEQSDYLGDCEEGTDDKFDDAIIDNALDHVAKVCDDTFLHRSTTTLLFVSVVFVTTMMIVTLVYSGVLMTSFIDNHACSTAQYASFMTEKLFGPGNLLSDISLFNDTSLLNSSFMAPVYNAPVGNESGTWTYTPAYNTSLASHLLGVFEGASKATSVMPLSIFAIHPDGGVLSAQATHANYTVQEGANLTDLTVHLYDPNTTNCWSAPRIGPDLAVWETSTQIGGSHCSDMESHATAPWWYNIRNSTHTWASNVHQQYGKLSSGALGIIFFSICPSTGIIYGVEVALYRIAALLAQYPQTGPTGVTYILTKNGSLASSSEASTWSASLLGDQMNSPLLVPATSVTYKSADLLPDLTTLYSKLTGTVTIGKEACTTGDKIYKLLTGDIFDKTPSILATRLGDDSSLQGTVVTVLPVEDYTDFIWNFAVYGSFISIIILGSGILMAIQPMMLERGENLQQVISTCKRSFSFFCILLIFAFWIFYTMFADSHTKAVNALCGIITQSMNGPFDLLIGEAFSTTSQAANAWCTNARPDVLSGDRVVNNLVLREAIIGKLFEGGVGNGVDAIHYGTSTGLLLGARKISDVAGGVCFVERLDAAACTSLWRSDGAACNSLLPEGTSDCHYDPRYTKWYKAGYDSIGLVSLVGSYILPSGYQGDSAVQAAQDANGDVVGVWSVDFRFSTLSVGLKAIKSAAIPSSIFYTDMQGSLLSSNNGVSAATITLAKNNADASIAAAAKLVLAENDQSFAGVTPGVLKAHQIVGIANTMIRYGATGTLNLVTIARSVTHLDYEQLIDCAASGLLFGSLLIGTILFGIVTKVWRLPAHYLMDEELTDVEHYAALAMIHGNMEGLTTELELKLYAKLFNHQRRKEVMEKGISRVEKAKRELQQAKKLKSVGNNRREDLLDKLLGAIQRYHRVALVEEHLIMEKVDGVMMVYGSGLLNDATHHRLNILTRIQMLLMNGNFEHTVTLTLTQGFKCY